MGFSHRKRPNVYKTLNRLVDKKWVVTETKGGHTLFFPVRPHIVGQNIVDEKRAELAALEEKLPLLEDQLEAMLQSETISLEDLDAETREFVRTVTPNRWFLRERPTVSKFLSSGRTVSIEFNTRRRFGGDSAGLVIFSFRYREHVNHFRQEADNTLRNGMIAALESQRGLGKFDVKRYEFSESPVSIVPEKPSLRYTVLTVYLNLMNMRGEGGFLSVELESHPTWIVGVWAASSDDLVQLVGHVSPSTGS